jgi:hypothetical protein
VRLQDLLTHLYVLIPVLDNEKHYWVAQDEIEKLLRRGEGWLPQHPEKDLIVSRYLKRQRHLTREALSRPGRIDGPDTSARVARSKCNSPQDGTVCTLGHTVNRGRSRAFTLEHDPFAVGDWVSE